MSETTLMFIKIWLLMVMTGYLIWWLFRTIREDSLTKARKATDKAIRAYLSEPAQDDEQIERTITAMHKIQEIYEEFLG